METAITLIQTLGFPIACVVALGLFAYYFITRIQDENLQRENKLMDIIQVYGEKLSAITATLEKLCGDVGELKHYHHADED